MSSSCPRDCWSRLITFTEADVGRDPALQTVDLGSVRGVLAVLNDAIIGVAVLATPVQHQEYAGEEIDDFLGASAFGDAADKETYKIVEAAVLGFLLGAQDVAPRVLGVLTLLEPLQPGPVVQVEVLPVRRMCTGDWAYFCLVRGHLGANAMCPCPMCEVTKEDAKNRVPKPWRTPAGIAVCAAKSPLQVLRQEGNVRQDSGTHLTQRGS